MAHTSLPDFIITKKRKRSRAQAVDTCLGFYPAPSSASPRDVSDLTSPSACRDPHPTAIPSSAEDVAHTSIQILAHSIIGQSESVEDALRGCRVVSQTQTPTDVVNFVRGFNFDRDDEVTLTVEGFLRSAAATTTQRYRRRRGGQNTKKETRQISWTSDEEYVPEKPTRKRQCRKKTQPLSARLLAAAVATGVDVVGGLLFPDPADAHTSTVRRLPLSLGGRAPSPVDATKSRRRRLVDPRKVRRAVSQFARTIEEPTVEKVKQQRPITAWEPKDHAVFGLQSGSSIGKSASAPVGFFATQPLALVSSADPRSAYQARCTTIVSRSCPIPRRRKAEAQHHQPGLPLESSRARSSANLPTAPTGSNTQRRNLQSSPTSSPRASLVPRFDAPSFLERNYGDSDGDQGTIGDCPDITRSPNTNISPAAVAFPQSPTPSVHASDLDEVLTSHGSPKPSSSHELDPLIALPPRLAPPKHLKPLGSLLDGLREIARSATQMANAEACVRPRPNTSSKENRFGDSDRSGCPSRSARPRPSTAQPLLPGYSVASATGHAQLDVSASSVLTPRSSKGGDGSVSTIHSLSGGSPEGDDSSRSIGGHVDAPPRTDRVDVLAILQSYQSKTILLPSSPLPGWHALPCSTMDAPDCEDSEENLY